MRDFWLLKFLPCFYNLQHFATVFSLKQAIFAPEKPNYKKTVTRINT